MRGSVLGCTGFVAAVALAASLGLAIATVGAAAPTDSGWPGFRWLYRDATPATRVTISLTRADVASGHVAVWLGVDNGERWLQGGIMQTPGVGPYLYAEIGIGLATRPTGVQLVNLGGYRLGDRISVSLETNARGRWWVAVDGHRFGSVYLGAASAQRAIATGEDCFLSGSANLYEFSLEPAAPGAGRKG